CTSSPLNLTCGSLIGTCSGFKESWVSPWAACELDAASAAPISSALTRISAPPSPRACACSNSASFVWKASAFCFFNAGDCCSPIPVGLTRISPRKITSAISTTQRPILYGFMLNFSASQRGHNSYETTIPVLCKGYQRTLQAAPQVHRKNFQ